MDDPYESDDAGPTTHVRGYQRLPLDDADLKPDPDREQNIQQRASGNSTLYDPPAYTPMTLMTPMTQGPQYNPAPPRFPCAPAPQTQQQSSNNVVVVNQPSSGSPMTIEEPIVQPPNDHLIFTICSIVLCFLLGNWVAFICLIPALCLSLAANNANSVRNYAGAKRSANISICCTSCVYMQFIAVITIGGVLLALLFTVGLGLIGLEKPDL